MGRPRPLMKMGVDSKTALVGEKKDRAASSDSGST